jgi:lipopolysaccharide exporter
MADGIDKKVQRGAGWMLLFKLCERGIGMVSTIILARLLVPQDFGLVAMATAIIAFLELLQAFGFDSALIQNQDAERPDYDTVWTLKLGLGAIIALLMLLLAHPAALYYNEPRVTPVLMVLAISALAGGAENVGVVDFRKKLQFNREFWFLSARKVASFVLTLSLAIAYRSYWALVAGMVFGRVFSTALSYMVNEYRPRLSLAAFDRVFSFSKWMLTHNFIMFFQQRAASLVLGRFGGPTVLGAFSIGQEIANIPASELIAPINRAVFPGYAKLSHDLRALANGFLKVMSIVALITLPGAIGIAAVAGPLVKVLLGDKWLAAIPVIEILALAGAIRALQASTQYIYMALNTLRVYIKVMAIHSAILMPALIGLTIFYGAEGASWSILLTALAMLPLYFATVMRALDIRAGEITGIVWRPALAAFTMYGVVQVTIARTSLDNWADAGILALAVIVGAGCYSLVIMLLWLVSGRPAGAERFALDQFAALVARWHPLAGFRSG